MLYRGTLVMPVSAWVLSASLLASTTYADTPRRGRAAQPAAAAVRPARRARICLARPVTLVRKEGGREETQTVSLTRCNGAPNRPALLVLSILARPHGTPRPDAGRNANVPRERRDPRTRVMRLDEGLLPRLQQIATRFRGRPIEIISGSRPDERDGSRHKWGRALDIRVRGVANETVRDYARTFENTGVGYYPNSVFVHVDVRDRKAYWVDRSGPGETADYGRWPPPPEETEARVATARSRIMRDLEAALGQHLDTISVTPPSDDHADGASGDDGK